MELPNGSILSTFLTFALDLSLIALLFIFTEWIDRAIRRGLHKYNLSKQLLNTASLSPHNSNHIGTPGRASLTSIMQLLDATETAPNTHQRQHISIFKEFLNMIGNY